MVWGGAYLPRYPARSMRDLHPTQSSQEALRVTGHGHTWARGGAWHGPVSGHPRFSWSGELNRSLCSGFGGGSRVCPETLHPVSCSSPAPAPPCLAGTQSLTSLDHQARGLLLFPNLALNSLVSIGAPHSLSGGMSCRLGAQSQAMNHVPGATYPTPTGVPHRKLQTDRQTDKLLRSACPREHTLNSSSWYSRYQSAWTPVCASFSLVFLLPSFFLLFFPFLPPHVCFLPSSPLGWPVCSEEPAMPW